MPAVSSFRLVEGAGRACFLQKQLRNVCQGFIYIFWGTGSLAILLGGGFMVPLLSFGSHVQTISCTEMELVFYACGSLVVVSEAQAFRRCSWSVKPTCSRPFAQFCSRMAVLLSPCLILSSVLGSVDAVWDPCLFFSFHSRGKKITVFSPSGTFCRFFSL